MKTRGTNERDGLLDSCACAAGSGVEDVELGLGRVKYLASRAIERWGVGSLLDLSVPHRQVVARLAAQVGPEQLRPPSPSALSRCLNHGERAAADLHSLRCLCVLCELCGYTLEDRRRRAHDSGKQGYLAHAAPGAGRGGRFDPRAGWLLAAAVQSRAALRGVRRAGARGQPGARSQAPQT